MEIKRCVVGWACSKYLLSSGTYMTVAVMPYFQMTLESLWLKKDLATANRLPILHHQLLPNFIFYETEMPEVR